MIILNEKILKKIKSDVETVKKISKILIKIDREHNVKLQFNDNLEKGIGGVIAVIGPTENFELEEVLLLEIGTGRSRPYAESIYPGYYVNCRKKLFEISSEQYKVVSPYIFKAIQFVADLRIAKWKCCPPNHYRVKYNSNWYTKRNGFNSLNISVDKTPAIRFAFAKTDEFVVNDMLCLFLSSDWTKKKMIGLGGYVDKILSVCKNKKRIFRRFKRFKNVIEVKKALKKWPDFLVKEMLLKHLPGGDKNFFFYEVAELIGWDGDTLSEEKKKALTSSIDRKDEAVSNIKNKINYVRKDDKFIFFDVCPSNYDPTKKRF